MAKPQRITARCGRKRKDTFKTMLVGGHQWKSFVTCHQCGSSVHAYVHAHVYLHAHTRICSNTLRHAHTCVHMFTQSTFLQRHEHTHMATCSRAQVLSCTVTFTCAHPHTHMCTHTLLHAHTKHTRTCMSTHTCAYAYACTYNHMLTNAHTHTQSTSARPKCTSVPPELSPVINVGALTDLSSGSGGCAKLGQAAFLAPVAGIW